MNQFEIDVMNKRWEILNKKFDQLNKNVDKLVRLQTVAAGLLADIYVSSTPGISRNDPQMRKLALDIAKIYDL